MTIRLGKTDASGDKRLSLFICSYILSSSMNIVVKTIFTIPESQWGQISRIFQLPIIILLLCAIPVIIMRKMNALVVSESLFVILYTISFLMGYAERGLLLGTAFWTLCVCVPIGVAGIAIYDKKILYSYLRITSYMEFPLLMIALFQMRALRSYSMSVSYAMVIPILFMLNDYFGGEKKISLILATSGSLMVLVFGARGPLICILFYCVVKAFFSSNIGKEGYKILIIRTIMISLAICIVIFWDKILIWIQSFAQGHNLDTYVIRRILTGQIFSSDARSDFREYYLELAQKKPLFGYGLMGGWIQSGSGPHNMLIELILAFGYVIGGAMCILAIGLLTKAVFSSKQKELILILAAYNITMYLVSGDWLQSPMFFLFVFLSFSRESFDIEEGWYDNNSQLGGRRVNNV